MFRFKPIQKSSLIVFIVMSIFSFTSYSPCNDVPELNKKVIAFVKASLNKKVGSGECWDLAAEALNKAGATWDGKQVFGKEVNYLKVCIYPGDIVQFEGVTLNYEIDKKIYIEKLQHHTAIVYEVKEKGNFVIADQNTGLSGKTVGTHTFEVKSMAKGKFKIFRPTK